MKFVVHSLFFLFLLCLFVNILFSDVGVAMAQQPSDAATPTLPAEFADQSPAMLPTFGADVAQPEQWDRYSIVVTLHPDEQRLSGKMHLWVTNRSFDPFTRLYFKLYPNHANFGGRLTITAAFVDWMPVASGTAHGDTLLWLDLLQPLPPGTTALVELNFEASTPRNASRRTTGLFNQEAGLWSMASFYPVLARYFLDSGWDDRPISGRGDAAVTATALYDVTVETPPAWQLVTTGVRIAADPLDNGWRRERFVSGPQREFYLGATRGLAQASATVDGVRLVSHYQPGNEATGQRALQVAGDALRIFSQHFGPYPLAELEVLQGAMSTIMGMEYPGVVLVDQNLYWNAGGRPFETIVAHEVAHQWWYSLVGNDAQGEAWIDEGLASYSHILYHEIQGHHDRARAELDRFRTLYRQVRNRGADAPLATPPSALGSAYVPIAYGKAALFFHAMRTELGEDAFKRFLQEFYATARYREIAGPDLLRAAEAACGCSREQFFHAWVLTATPVPIP
ncbi:MAG: M1 family peptidase [Candidatus Viridilinea halotolerans]|uniref:M1 family peptidase n=1 Tax=Candidatus Viridilinea halotolerans TaxID=2491704 RepID=A0A426TXX6_9CHLR|nr:MAG: M1 family peptidase [Candidatus Viridilinea halotolerans]